MRRGPPPRECSGSEGEEEVAHFVDELRVSARRPTWVAAEERQHKVCRGVKVEQRLTTLELAGLGLRRPLAVLDRCAPLAAPRACHVDPVGPVSYTHLTLPTNRE